MLPAFVISGASPASRRASLASLGDTALVEQLVVLACGLREANAFHAPLARAASLPLAEVLASPFALRATALGVEAGASTVHLELRARPEWPEALGVASEVRDAEHGVWDRGVLKSGKYQGFLADEAFAAYDPSHVSKWGPHELLHRAARFFFREGATRWEHYLGARLNELVPVVAWYGPEQVMRLDEGAFDRAAAGRAPAARLEEARWLTEDALELRARAERSVPILRAGLAHFERELGAIDEELTRGRRVRASHPLLDASSDATAYVTGHFDRLRSSPVTLVLGEVLPDAWVARDVGAYRDEIEGLFDRLLFAPVLPDRERAEARRSGRALWDLLHRMAHLGEAMEPELEPLAGDARRAIEAAERGVAIDVRAFRERACAGLASEEAAIVLSSGLVEPADIAGPALAQLADGIRSVIPCTWALLDDPGALARLARSEALWDRAPLAVRVARWIDAEDLHEMASLEQAIATARRDDTIERLAVPREELPDAIEHGMLARNEAFAMCSFEHDVVEVHAALSSGEPASRPMHARGRWLVGALFDDVSVVPCPDAVALAWEALGEGALDVRDVEALIDGALGAPREGWPEDGAAWVRELLDAGALGWMGPPLTDDGCRA